MSETTTATAPPATATGTELVKTLLASVPETAPAKPTFKPRPWGDYTETKKVTEETDPKIAAKVRRKAVQLGLVKPKRKRKRRKMGPVEKILRRVPKLLGKNAEHWTKNQTGARRDGGGVGAMISSHPLAEATTHYCVLGAVAKAAGHASEDGYPSDPLGRKARNLLRRAAGGRCPFVVNDNSGFGATMEMVRKATELAKREGL